MHMVIKEKTYEIINAVCDECGEEMDIPGLIDISIKSIINCIVFVNRNGRI